VASTVKYDRKMAEVQKARKAKPAKRACKVCQEPVGDGFGSFCGAEHMFKGRK
jgi:hypothetical protein